jgi:DNA-directed RNA polymerase specialized sigma subunit
MSQDSSEHFRVFAASLERAIAEYEKVDPSEFSTIQKQQIEKLVHLENEWRLAVIKHRNGKRAYSSFIEYICEENKNVLTARPFFRERQKIFTSSITVALKKKDWRKLFRFRINWNFINFVMNSVKWHPGSLVVELSKQIAATRHQLVIMNLPLAIHRSRIFWSRTPKSHLSFMDFTSIATTGLISAIDKFVLPYSPVFCSVAIGRMVGNFIEDYSATTIHFFPTDRRKIYRANKFLSRHAKGDYEVNDLVVAVNKNDIKHDGSGSEIKQKERQKTSDIEIVDLVAAASTVSADTKAPGEHDVPDNVARYEAPEDCRPDVQYERIELTREVYRIMETLPLIDRKLLRLKGIDSPL